MAYIDRIAVCRVQNLSKYRPFVLGGEQYGWVSAVVAKQIADFPEVFQVSDQQVTLAETLTGCAERTEAIDAVMRRLRERGDIAIWFEEKFPAKKSFDSPSLFEIERAAVPLFGLPAFGVHLNGYVGSGADIMMWVGERAHDDPIEPGKYDQLVAGGQPANLSVEENLTKECAEEAGIDATLAAQAVHVGNIRYTMERPEGLRCDELFMYDLLLEPSFKPVNKDGEVEAFHLMPIRKVDDIVRDTDDFKFNCSLVVIDFLIRHGILTPDHPEYMDCVKGLRD